MVKNSLILCQSSQAENDSKFGVGKEQDVMITSNLETVQSMYQGHNMMKGIAPDQQMASSEETKANQQ